MTSGDDSDSGDGSGRLRDIYGQMFLYHHCLPDEVGRQKPSVLFYMLDNLPAAEDKSRQKDGKINFSSPYMRAVFG